MEKIDVWRLHNEFGNGPYNGTGNIFNFMSAHAKEEGHSIEHCPPPWRDKELSKIFRRHADFLKEKHLRCGFLNIQQYEEWFISEFFRNALDATGFFLARYSLPEQDIINGDKQVVFILKNAAITEFRRCHQPHLVLEQNHPPIQRFLTATDIPVQTPCL